MIEPVVRLRITLQDIEPAILRRVHMPVSAARFALFTVIQAGRWDCLSSAACLADPRGERLQSRALSAPVPSFWHRVAEAKNVAGQVTPVDPNPSAPRSVVERWSTTTTLQRLTSAITAWAILSPWLIVNEPRPR